MRALLVAAIATVALWAVAPAGGQSPSLKGTWTGSVQLKTTKVAVRYTFDGARSGTTRYRGKGRTCRGRLTLRTRERGGFVFRDRLVSGSPCTNGDSVFVTPAAGGLSVRVHERRGRITRFTLRKAG